MNTGFKNAGINYADVQALVRRGMKRGLLQHGAPVRALGAEDLPKAYPAAVKHIPASVWAGVDWSRKNPDLARELGCSAPTVSMRRAQYAPHTVVSRASKFDWSRVDWSRSSRALAKELGCVESYVSRQRRIHALSTLQVKYSVTKEAL